jgi:AraC family transcriptional regulator
MKKDISAKRTRVTNNLMHYIYNYIDSAINLDIISKDIGISKFYLHRIFKDEFGANIYETIKSIRLQKAANLLITNHNSTISQVAALCGYGTQTSFIRAFKEHFAMTPKQWRQGGFITYSNTLLSGIDARWAHGMHDFKLTPVIKKIPDLKLYYIRHRGYDASIKECWQKLQTFVLANDIKNFKQIAFYHDNPIIVPLERCNYVACIQTDDPLPVEKPVLPSFRMSTGVYAEFQMEGYNDDILRLIQWIYHEWLPKSGYETTTAPSFVVYEENNFLNENGFFSLTYGIPIVLA